MPGNHRGLPLLSLLSGWVAMVMAGRQLCLAPSVHTSQTHTLAAQGREGQRVEQDESGFYLSLYPSPSYLFLNTFRDTSLLHLSGPHPHLSGLLENFPAQDNRPVDSKYGPLQYLPQPLLAKPLAAPHTHSPPLTHCPLPLPSVLHTGPSSAEPSLPQTRPPSLLPLLASPHWQ